MPAADAADPVLQYSQYVENLFLPQHSGFEQIQKKLAKGKSAEIIADEVEESVELVEQLIAEIEEEHSL